MGKSKGNSELLLALLGGVAIGATVAVLHAPDSGRATRAKLKKKAERAARNMAATASGLTENTLENLEEGGDNLGYIIGASIARTVLSIEEIIKIVNLKITELKLGLGTETDDDVYQLEDPDGNV